jgi:hypothetical protein
MGLDKLAFSRGSANHVTAEKEPNHRPIIEGETPQLHERVEFRYVHELDCSGEQISKSDMMGHL